MKLVRYGPAGREKPGIVDADGKIRDLSRVVKDIDGEMLASGGIAKIKKANLKKLKVVPGKPRLGPCVGHVGNFIAIGLNYSDHAAEAGMPIPKEPIIFNKAPTSICGAIAESLVLAERAGIERRVAYDVLEASAARSPVMEYRRPQFERPDEAPVSFSMHLTAKDYGLILGLARDVGAPMPQATLNAELVDRAIASGLGDADIAALAALFRDG